MSNISNYGAIALLTGFSIIFKNVMHHLNCSGILFNKQLVLQKTYPLGKLHTNSPI